MNKAFFSDAGDAASAGGMTDLMTSLAVIFMLILAATLTRVEEDSRERPSPEPALTRDMERPRGDLAREGTDSHPHVLTVAIPDTRLQFEFGKSLLLPSADAFLEDSMPEYAAMICGPRGHEVESFVIEGHTDDVGDDIRNLKLSQERSFAVLAKGLEVVRRRMPWAYECFHQKTSATGRGTQDLVRTDTGLLDRDKSRRVVFTFHLR